MLESSIGIPSYSVYVIRNKKNVLYTGIALNITKRLAQHNAGKGAKFTRGRGPWVLIYSSDPLPISEALRLESKLKRDRKFKLALKNNSNSNH
jgi:putative endonuclease|tara:strand:+ start:114 stop:392 length:279 start_codon:yes stop_codon:yes gene_type:complete